MIPVEELPIPHTAPHSPTTAAPSATVAASPAPSAQPEVTAPAASSDSVDEAADGLDAAQMLARRSSAIKIQQMQRGRASRKKYSATRKKCEVTAKQPVLAQRPRYLDYQSKQAPPRRPPLPRRGGTSEQARKPAPPQRQINPPVTPLRRQRTSDAVRQVTQVSRAAKHLASDQRSKTLERPAPVLATSDTTRQALLTSHACVLLCVPELHTCMCVHACDGHCNHACRCAHLAGKKRQPSGGNVRRTVP